MNGNKNWIEQQGSTIDMVGVGRKPITPGDGRRVLELPWEL